MPKQACISMRPGTIFGFKGEVYRVISNETLLRRFTAQNTKRPSDIRSFNYMPGQEIQVRWVPFNSK